MPANDDNAKVMGWHRRTGSNDCAGGGDATYHCPTSQEGPGYDVSVPTVTTRRYAVIMVGLPARGKTFLAQKISRYLAWLGYEAAVFNVQRQWREGLGVLSMPSVASQDYISPQLTPMQSPAVSVGAPEGTTPRTDSESANGSTHPQFISADVFAETVTPDSTTYKKAIDHSVSRVKDFFSRGGLMAFINDDFVTSDTRKCIERKLEGIADKVLYIEVVRDDDLNARFEKLKVANAGEYGAAAGSDEAAKDFARRVELLRNVYEPLGDDTSFIRIRNGSHVELHDVRGYLPSRMISFLMHLSPQNKVFAPIYFSRHGQSEYNLEDRLGGNPRLTERGQLDALALREFIAKVKADNDSKKAMPVQIWTSQLQRTIETARPAEESLGLECLRWRNLNEIHAGVCENLTYAEVKEKYPVIHDFRQKNKYAFRYPDGESYQDLVARLEPVIMELENSDRVVVVVAHQAVLRALLAYFGGNNAEHSVRVEVPHRTVWRCSYDEQGIPTVDELELPPPQTKASPGPA